jgi:HAD superfamily hydrolase (TIGR01509 family)
MAFEEMVKIRGVLFDHDGLIVDTETPAYVSWCEIYHEYGVELALDEWVKCVGGSGLEFDPLVHLESLTELSIDRVGIRNRRLHRKRELVLEAEPIHGVRDRLKEAQQIGLLVGVVSSAGIPTIKESLERLNLIQYVNILTCGDEVDFVKPAPDLYHLAMRRLGLTPQETLVFEDSPNGVLSALEAEIHCIAIPNAITKSLVFPNVKMIQSLGDHSLMEIISML